MSDELIDQQSGSYEPVSLERVPGVKLTLTEDELKYVRSRAWISIYGGLTFLSALPTDEYLAGMAKLEDELARAIHAESTAKAFKDAGHPEVEGQVAQAIDDANVGTTESVPSEDNDEDSDYESEYPAFEDDNEDGSDFEKLG